jgi:O-succinylbenzoic acid--CoA ligase
VIFTSGSSGFPKGVALTGAQLKASAEAHHSRFPNHTWLLSIPPYHIGGFSILSRAHFSDLPFALSSAKAEEILVRMQAGGVDGISLVPTQLEKLLALVNGSAPIPLKAVLLGGAQAGESLLVRATDWPIFLTYGMTETASQCATATSPFSPLEPLPQYEFRLRTDGELLVRGPSLANGYFVQGGLQPLPQVDGFFPTGDLGQPISPNSQAEKQLGRFAILGRKSDRIQTGGMKLFPQEIEEKLKNFSSMFSDFGICAIPDPLWGEAICLAYVANDKAANAEKIEETVRNFLSQVLDKKLLPKHLLPLEKIPRTESGKIQRQELSFMVSALLQKKSERI